MSIVCFEVVARGLDDLSNMDLNVRTSQELDFRLISASKHLKLFNSETHIFRLTPQDSLSVSLFLS